MVKCAMKTQQRATNGFKVLIESEAATQVQAVWRFLNNPNATTDDLFSPIVTHLEKEINKQCNKYVLMPSDWSNVNYRNHTSKKDRIYIKGKDSCKQNMYDLQSTIALSDVTGEPIASVVHNLKTTKKVYSTYDNNIDMKLTHMEELLIRANWIRDSIQSENEPIHIVDRESDVISSMRGFDKEGHLFLFRGKDNSKVEYFDKELNKKIDLKQSDLADKLPLGELVKSIKYRKKDVEIYANECEIMITRDATKSTKTKEGKTKIIKTPGNPLKLRFIVERLVDKDGEIVAQWILLSNVFDDDITASTLANWYYFRWKIESYFKLLKSSGFNLEEWQQRDPLAIFKRLLIVSNASMFVWKIANDKSSNARRIREILIQLSGKQIQRGIDWTYPALLSGLESYLTTIDLLTRFSVDEIFKLKDELEDIIGFKM
jgi:uncharacterized protein YoxC